MTARLAAAVVLAVVLGERAAGAQHGEHGMPGRRHPPVEESHEMPAMYGPYPFGREASGTAWQPDAGTHEGLHRVRGPWAVLLHGFADATYTDQGGPRGDRMFFVTSMAMGLATRRLAAGRLGLRLMMSADPLGVGRDGYPLLLQTGETGDGASHLIDRQHPHDLLMEMAAAYTVSDATRSVFAYVGYPGEPALGPPVYMHRASGVAFPESPIGHHWFDSTHITYGVATIGVVLREAKLEGSVFTGREPDQHRYGLEAPRFDSRSVRATWNPTPRWSLQASAGRLRSPEQLEPDVDTDRITSSVACAATIGGHPWWSAAVWGRNRNRPGEVLDAFLLESVFAWRQRHTWMLRGERVEKDELFVEGDARAGRVFTVGKVEAGYLHELAREGPVGIGFGVLGAVALVPRGLEDVYGERSFSGTLFVRLRLR